MIPFETVKTLFFDYDGTLHNSIALYAPSFRKAYQFLVEKGFAKERLWTDQEISYWLGFNPEEMWQTFMPHLSETLREECSTIIGSEIQRQMQTDSPKLYKGALEVLEYLKNKGYQLVFISNCKTYYKDCHNKLFNLGQYFQSLVCSDEYGFIPKHEILKRIKNQYPESMVIIGDRKQDIEAGKKNNISTIGCTYGYALEGELEYAELLIDDIRQLKNYL